MKSGTLSDLCSIITDGTHDSPKLQESGVPFIKGKHISSGFVDFENCDFISPEDHAHCIKRINPQKDDILFSNIGSVGDTAVVNSSQEFSIKNVALFRPDSGKADPRYVYYLVCSPAFRSGILNLRSGAAQPFISLANLRGFEFDYEPDLPTQRKIAGILSAYDDLIENNLRRIRILEEMAQSLYREWFVHFRFPGHESTPLVDSPLGPIPEGWEVKKLGDIAQEVRRGIPKGELKEPMPYVGLEHIPRQSLALDDWEIVSELGSNKLIFEPGEILFGKIRPYFHKVSVAPFSGACSADTIVIRAKIPEDTSLVTACVSSEAFVAHASATANGAKMPRADWKILVKYPVLQPPKYLKKAFTDFFSNAVAEQQNLIRRNQNLRQTRDLLLPKLLKP